ncbi:MAG: flagellar basal body rod protein FlgC [Planctomycetes bacterium]|nr:flagellar basal body rod protein FlgC [Planctomycetota bacterium]NOG53596.1 flagellar basal body rod protein FlgC [Planctomycetota bacterium]
MYGLLDISTSGMVAQRARLAVAAGNTANAYTVAGPDGEYAPYRRRSVILGEGSPGNSGDLGVHVQTIELNDGPFKKQYMPNHPFADAAGYVDFPDIDPAIERINSIEAMRAYEANVTVAETTKAMVGIALRLLA